MSTGQSNGTDLSRRDFMQRSTLAAAGMSVGPRAFAAGADTLRVGLIGCGGRGTGAARDCLTGSEGVELVALGDLFPDRAASCREALANLASEDPAKPRKYRHHLLR